jgi:hypothetical protein
MRWRDEAAAVERALELLRELPDTEAGEWSAWAWERIDDEPAAAARLVSHDVEKLRRSLRRFVAEHELAHGTPEGLAERLLKTST